MDGKAWDRCQDLALLRWLGLGDFTLEPGAPCGLRPRDESVRKYNTVQEGV